MMFRTVARFAAKQIEGEAAKTGFVGKATAFVGNSVKCGTPIYSLAYGAVAGLVLSGVVFAGRTASIVCFDHEYVKLQSRKRYFEKQMLFEREQDEAAQAHYLAALSAEYDPAACRLPFKALDAKWRF
eukprot:TRINITY_DN989_c0_g1_i1.p1 TRINITY_DN989_c0_g1~~TRINITY_DN989_c0_g1_i1.p1  ORF type:complete len:128 (+),score=44.19 TRINITY_DN989_c0_g1_i1:95-478(+)